MAHFAKLDENNQVLEVLVVHNDVLMENGQEVEQLGIDFLANLTGHANWKQTSYNNKFRGNYAGIGYSYDPVRDAFLPPSPYPSWILNANFGWDPPIPMPADGNLYSWDEPTTSWVPAVIGQ